MKILYISSTASGMQSQSIYFDLMQEFVAQGHHVTCVYASDGKVVETPGIQNKFGVDYLKVECHNITKNKNKFKKGLALLSIDAKFLASIKQHLSTTPFDLVLYSTPPITFIKTLKYFKERNIKIYLMLKDIFPQNAVDLGMFKENGVIHRFFSKKETTNYEMADYIGVMSEANKRYLSQHFPFTETKTTVLPNAINTENYSRYDVNRSVFNLPENDTLFLYGGNIGKPQSPEFIMQCIDRFESVEHAKFIICGWGSDMSRIIEHIENHNIKNTVYLGSLDVAQYNQLTQLIDVGLIFLDFNFTIPNFPQRLLGYLKDGKPVICATDLATDIGAIAEANNFGISVPSNDVEAWAHAVETLKDSALRNQMGWNGIQYLKHNFDVKIAYNIIVNHVGGSLNESK